MIAYDYVVVGAGMSGWPLAVRLAEGGARVAVLEAGSAAPSEALDAASLELIGAGRQENWNHPASLTSSVRAGMPRGRAVGGSSVVNGGAFTRARASDVELWHHAGGNRWSPREVGRVFRDLETDRTYSGPAHGARGPMPVARPSQDHPVIHAFTEAARSLGFTNEADKNSDAPAGIGPLPMNVIDGVRVNVAMAYAAPPSLDLLTNAIAVRVVFSGRVARGVEYVAATGTRQIVEAAEIVLCAGAIGTTTLLLRSGIGPRDTLDRAGVQLVAESPTLGLGFSDHPQVRLDWRASGALPVARTVMGVALHTFSGVDDEEDLELVPLLRPLDQLLLTGAPHVMSVLVTSTSAPIGTLRLGPDGEPIIEQHYLETEADRSRLRRGVALARELLSTSAFRGMLRKVEGPAVADDEWIAGHIGTAYHLSGTARMGEAVDGSGLVNGVSRLRVADTSILPLVPTRGPAASAVLIGELVSAQILRA